MVLQRVLVGSHEHLKVSRAFQEVSRVFQEATGSFSGSQRRLRDGIWGSEGRSRGIQRLPGDRVSETFQGKSKGF